MNTCHPPRSCSIGAAAQSRDPHRPSLHAKRLLLAALVAALAPGAAFAAVINGSVLNQNTKKYLERASVEAVGTPFKTLTSAEGQFRLSGLPAGTYTLNVSYTGLDPQTRTITVTQDETAAADFELTADVYQLDAFVVTSAIEGTAYAINQQRRAESARSVTSVDAFIDQATGNPGEFLKSVEGIQMDYSQNEPQTIRVRGFDPNLTTVTMDGNEIASAASSSANRAVQIDQLSIGGIENVEVYKAPIPSMSANAIGGAVNFNTKSAFDQKGYRAYLQAGVNMDSHDFHFRKTPSAGHGDRAERRVYPSGRFMYSNSFFGNRLGVMFTTGRDHTNQLGSSAATSVTATALSGSTLPVAPALYTLDNVSVLRGGTSLAPNRQLRTRADASLNLDYKVSDSIVAYLRSSITDYHSTNRNHSFGLPITTLASGATLTDYTVAAGTPTQGASVFDKYTRTTQLSPGLKIQVDDWKIDVNGGFSKSINHYQNPENFTSVNAVLSAPASWKVSIPTDSDAPTSITQISGPDIYDLNNYRPNQSAPAGGVLLANSSNFVANNKRDSWNAKYSGRFDVQRDFHTKFPFYLKGGVAYTENIFDKNQQQRRWYWAGDDGVIGTADDNTTAANLGRFAEPVPVTLGIPGINLREPTYLSTNEIWSYWQKNRQVLVENEAYALQQQYVGRQKVNEQVRAAYLMGVTTVQKLNVLAGVRVEETKLRTLGYRVLPTSGSTSVLPAGVNANSLEGIRASYRFATTDADYRSDPFPYLHLKYELLPGLQARASYTEAIGRPNLSDVVPSVSQNDTTMTISTNRAGLKPQRSQNLDFSIEYYTRSSGQLSAGWFSRDVDDYISTQTVPMTADLLDELNLGSDYASYQVTSKFNLGNAKWDGFELSFRQSLRDWKFFPGYLSGISVWGNYTKITKMSGDFGTVGSTITKLANVVPELINAGVSYRSPRGKLLIQLSTNFQGRKSTVNLPATNATAQLQPYVEDYQFWNLETSYQLTNRLRLTCTGRNIDSERQTTTNLGIVTNRQQATGIAWLFTAKYDL